jgi:hypothetical protein
MLHPHGHGDLGTNGNGAHDGGPDQAALALLRLEEVARPRLGIRRTRGRSGEEAPLATLARELARSRRYRRPLALVGIVPAAGARQTAAATAASVRALVRAVDSVWASAASVFVLLPESDRGDGEGLLARLQQQAADVLDGASANIAVFPTDGLTGGALLEVANGRMLAAAVEPPAPGRDGRGLKAVNTPPAPAAESAGP